MAEPKNPRLANMGVADSITVALEVRSEGTSVGSTDDDTFVHAATDAGHLGIKFLDVATRVGDHPALITTDRLFSYHEIARASLRVAGFLDSSLSFTAGDRVLLIAKNSLAYMAGLYGTLLAGGVVVPLPEKTSRDRCDLVAGECEARVTLLDATSQGQFAGRESGTAVLLNLLAASNPSGPPLKISHSDGDSLAMLLYTSGSTGKPKGVMLSHGNLLANAASIAEFLPIEPTDRALTVIPFCHAYGNSVLQTHMLAGATLVVDGTPTFPITITEAMRRHGVTSFAGVPELYHSLLSCSDLGEQNLPDLRYMTVAGGKMPAATANQIAGRISPAKLFVMYGQTEATARLACLPPEDLTFRADSIGRAIPGVALRVLDTDGSPAKTGDRGELCARGDNVMLGYWNDQAATDAALTDGWLRTGDIAHADSEGYFYLHGRRNQEVKIRGIRVDLTAVAAALSDEVPGCHFVAVAFDANSITRIALFAKSNVLTPSMEEIQDACRDRLAEHEIPSYIEQLADFPLNDALKIDRQSLSAWAAKQFDASCANESVLGGGSSNQLLKEVA